MSYSKKFQLRLQTMKPTLNPNWNATFIIFNQCNSDYMLVSLMILSKKIMYPRKWLGLILFNEQIGNYIVWFLLNEIQLLWFCSFLEPRQFKNNLIMFESKLILKLPPFFLPYTVRKKRGNFKTRKFFQLPWIVLMLSLL